PSFPFNKRHRHRNSAFNFHWKNGRTEVLEMVRMRSSALVSNFTVISVQAFSRSEERRGGKERPRTLGECRARFKHCGRTWRRGIHVVLPSFRPSRSTNGIVIGPRRSISTGRTEGRKFWRWFG